LLGGSPLFHGAVDADIDVGGSGARTRCGEHGSGGG